MYEFKFSAKKLLSGDQIVFLVKLFFRAIDFGLSQLRLSQKKG